MLRNAVWIVSLCAGLAVAAAPVFAADMAMKKGEMKKGEMHHAARHKWSCYDYAWKSQAQKDCLAKPAAEHKPAMHHVHHKSMKKPMAKPMMEKKS